MRSEKEEGPSIGAFFNLFCILTIVKLREGSLAALVDSQTPAPLVTEEAQLAWSQQFSPQLQLQQICFPANKNAAVHSDILQTPGLKQADTILLLQSCVTCEEHFQNAVKDYLINLLVSGDINI